MDVLKTMKLNKTLKLDDSQAGLEFKGVSFLDFLVNLSMLPHNRHYKMNTKVYDVRSKSVSHTGSTDTSVMSVCSNLTTITLQFYEENCSKL